MGPTPPTGSSSPAVPVPRGSPPHTRTPHPPRHVPRGHRQVGSGDGGGRGVSEAVGVSAGGRCAADYYLKPRATTPPGGVRARIIVYNKISSS